MTPGVSDTSSLVHLIMTRAFDPDDSGTLDVAAAQQTIPNRNGPKVALRRSENTCESERGNDTAVRP